MDNVRREKIGAGSKKHGFCRLTYCSRSVESMYATILFYQKLRIYTIFLSVPSGNCR